nr:MAG TPA: hypothetical protein [Caudoviricetes sp.]
MNILSITFLCSQTISSIYILLPNINSLPFPLIILVYSTHFFI